MLHAIVCCELDCYVTPYTLYQIEMMVNSLYSTKILAHKSSSQIEGVQNIGIYSVTLPESVTCELDVISQV